MTMGEPGRAAVSLHGLRIGVSGEPAESVRRLLAILEHFGAEPTDEDPQVQVRFDAESGTARIRTHEGSAELAKGSRGLYRDDGGEWMLTLSDASDTELWHKGSTKYKQCAAK
jgi:hypothetical protein